MTEPKTRFERWLGTGVIWQLALVASGLGMLYYTRMQALNAEATGREALAKIQAEAKANFEKLETTLRETEIRLAKLESSPLAAKQQEAINTLQAKLSELQGKYTKPEQIADLRNLGDTVRERNQDWLNALQGNSTNVRVAIPFDTDRGLTSFPKKASFLDGTDRMSLQQLLDEVKIPSTPSFGFRESPKFEWKPIQPMKPQTTAETLINTAKSYWFLIVIVLAFFLNRKKT